MSRIQRQIDHILLQHDTKTTIQRYLFHVQSGDFTVVFTGRFDMHGKNRFFLTQTHTDGPITMYRCHNSNLVLNSDHVISGFGGAAQVIRDMSGTGKRISTLRNEAIFPQGILLTLKRSTDKIMYVQAKYEFEVNSQSKYFILSHIELIMNTSLQVLFHIKQSKNSRISVIEMSTPAHVHAMYRLNGAKVRKIFALP